MGSSRAYRFEAGEPLPEEIARVALGRIDHAVDELRGRTDSSEVEAVHEARKDMKKLRALLRLARGELGERTFARENACFRDAAAELAGARDADVMLETLEALDLPAGVRWELRKVVQAHRARGGSGRDAAARRVAAMLKEARGRVRDWPLERDSFDALADGLERTYRRGRRDLRAAREEPGTEALHEWRKRVKQLWYQHGLLRSLSRPVMEAAAGEAHELSNLLGEEHDLAVLEDWMSEHGAAEPELLEAIERRRQTLTRDALALGERLYAERPRAYVARMERLWQARQARIRAP